jgi:hypothetical protein
MKEDYKNILPSLLLKNWEKYGFNPFRQGLFWLINPEEYQGLLEDYVEGTLLEDMPDLYVIARSAFGKLYVWEKDKGMTVELDFLQHQIYYSPKEQRLNVQEQEESMKALLSKIPKISDMYDDTHKSLFVQAYEIFGMLTEDEMYAYKQPLYLGGENNIENIEKKNLFIHADIQRGLNSPYLMVIK